MTDVIQWAKLQDLSPIISELTWPERSYMVLERVPDAWLADGERENGLRLEAFDPAEPFNDWERGRVFCAAFELRWEKLDGAFQAVYVGPPANLAGFALAQELDLSAAKPEPHRYYLWGTRVPDDQLDTVGAEKRPGAQVFIELIVPRVLHYPVSPQATRVMLSVIEYVDPDSGALLYHRFQGLEGISHEPV